jgi:hypothetical protein
LITRKLVRAAPAILLLAVLAVAAAMWNDSLKIHAVINTGNVDIEFIGLDGGPMVTDNEPPFPYTTNDKNVGNCTARSVEIQNEEETTNSIFPQFGSNAGNNDLELEINVINAYPSYFCSVSQIAVKNTGTVPVKVLVKLLLPPGASCTPKVFFHECDLDNDGDLDLNIGGNFLTLNTSQINPGGMRAFSVDLHVKQGAPESATFVVKLLIIGIQWNEFPS